MSCGIHDHFQKTVQQFLYIQLGIFFHDLIDHIFKGIYFRFIDLFECFELRALFYPCKIGLPFGCG